MATNSRLGIDVNLPSGARYDLLLIDHPDGYPESKIEFKMNNTPRKITGIQFVAQMFIKCLLTSRGTDVLNQNYGTDFSNYTINSNRTQSDPDLISALSTEIRAAETQTKYILNTTGADKASTLAQITVLAIDTATQSITIYLRILTGAGQLAQVAIPFPELDMKLSET